MPSITPLARAPHPGMGGVATAGDNLVRTLTAAGRHVLALSLAELAVNLALSVAMIAVALGLAAGIHGLVERRLRSRAKQDGEGGLKTTRALRWGRSFAYVCITLTAGDLLLAIWGFDPSAWWEGAGGRAFLGLMGRMTVLAAVFVAAMEMAGALIRRTMSNLISGARDPRRAAQLRTLAPLLRGVVQAIILLIGSMMLLSQLGVQIGPLIAGAGVAGIAIGFGAQSLVKDVLTGFFLIVEDIVSVGDTVSIAGFKGDVESMTLRTIRLRDFDGSLHIFPYGEAQVIHNQTKAFSYAVIDLQISYRSDVDVALATMGKVGASLRHDPVLGPRILADMEVLGVENLKESGLQLRGRIKTRPGADSGVTREFNRLIKAAFDENAITISSPHMRLVLPEGVEPGDAMTAKSS
jgi:small conductance mechanosensitive channel